MPEYDKEDTKGVESNTIDMPIRGANLDEFRIWEGDCRSIAKAIQNVFGGEIVAVLDENGSPRHAVVEIDGNLYDGSGLVTKEGIVEMFMPLEYDGEINYNRHLSKSESKDIFVCDQDKVERAEEKIRKFV